MPLIYLYFALLIENGAKSGLQFGHLHTIDQLLTFTYIVLKYNHSQDPITDPTKLDSRIIFIFWNLKQINTKIQSYKLLPI